MKRLLATMLLLVFSLVGCQQVADGLIKIKGISDFEVATKLVEQLGYQKISLAGSFPILEPREGDVRIAFELAKNSCEQIIMTQNKSTEELDILFVERMSGLFSNISAEHYQELTKVLENSFGKKRVDAEDISSKVGKHLVPTSSSCGNK